jgi:hypothetical protein
VNVQLLVEMFDASADVSAAASTPRFESNSATSRNAPE